MHILTTSQIISVAKISEYLSANEISRGSLFGKKLDERLPKMIYTERKSLEWMFDIDPINDSLLEVGNYVYALCGKYQLQAKQMLDLIGGGQVNIIGARINYPFVITSIDFEEDQVTYINPSVVGDELMVFITGYNQEWQFAGTAFEYTSNGIEFILPGFQASDYGNIIVQRINYVSH